MKSLAARTMGLLCLLWLLVAPPAWAVTGTTVDESLDGLLKRLDLKELEVFSREAAREVGPYLPEMNLRSILADLRAGRPVLDPVELLQAVGRFLWGEILTNTKVMGELMVLAVLFAVLQNLQAAFQRPVVSDLALFVVLMALLVLAVGSFTLAMQTGRETVDRMTSFMQALLPVLLTLVMAMGGAASSAIMHPLILSSLTLSGTLIKDVVLPLLYFAAILNIVGRLSTRFNVSRLADTFRVFATISLGLFITLAVGVLAVQGAAAKAADCLTLRAAKFASTTFIPVVGKTLSDAVEVAAGAGGLAINGVEVLALLALVGIAIFPALKIAVLALMYHLTAALVQPFGDARISDTLAAMGGTLGLIFAALLAVALFFFLSVSMIVGLANIGRLF